MKNFKLWLSAAVIAIAALRSTLPDFAFADTFQIFNLGDANDHNIVGVDTSGAAVISSPTGPLSSLLYQTYVDGVVINSSATIPNLIYDNGTPCTPTVSAPITWSSGLGQTRCNNGHEVYFGTFPVPPPGAFGESIFTGPNLTDRLPGGSLDSVVMNASGDFVWVDGIDETIFEAIDTTVPEPGAILLLGTGTLAVAVVMRRRFLQ
jgi:hypothetical protein